MSFTVQTSIVKETPHFSGIPCLAELSVETWSKSCQDGKPGKIRSQARVYLGTKLWEKDQGGTSIIYKTQGFQASSHSGYKPLDS